MLGLLLLLLFRRKNPPFTFFQQAKEEEYCGLVVLLFEQSKGSGRDKGGCGYDTTCCSARTIARVTTSKVSMTPKSSSNSDVAAFFGLVSACKARRRRASKGIEPVPDPDTTHSNIAVKGGKQNGLQDTHINSITAGQTGQPIGGL